MDPRLIWCIDSTRLQFGNNFKAVDNLNFSSVIKPYLIDFLDHISSLVLVIAIENEVYLFLTERQTFVFINSWLNLVLKAFM